MDSNPAMASSEQHLQGRRRTNLADLPLEIIQRILIALPAAERARAAVLCRHIATAIVGSEAGSVWHEATLPPLLLSGNSFASLLTWTACRSKDLQRLRLSTISAIVGEDSTDVTFAIAGPLHAVHTLRIDGFQDNCAVGMCASMLLSMAHRPMTTRLQHLALHGLTLPADDPQLVAAVQAQGQLVECVLDFNLELALCAAGALDGAATVLTAAGACSKLQRLCVGTKGSLKLRYIPDSVAALGSLTCLQLRHCQLRGPQKLPPNLVDLLLHDFTTCTLPASLGAMTSLTRLTAFHALGPPLAWPPQLIFLEVDGGMWDAAGHTALGPRLASLSTVTGLRFLKLNRGNNNKNYHKNSVGACEEYLDIGTASLSALVGLSITKSGLDTLPSLSCISRLTAIDLSGNFFSAVPQSLRAATACVALDLTNTLGKSGLLDLPSFRIFGRLTALRRLSLKGVKDQKFTLSRCAQELPQVLQAVKEFMFEQCATAEVAVAKTDHFAAVMPDPPRFLETEQGWRL